jgi:hypothetical protein
MELPMTLLTRSLRSMLRTCPATARVLAAGTLLLLSSATTHAQQAGDDALEQPNDPFAKNTNGAPDADALNPNAQGQSLWRTLAQLPPAVEQGREWIRARRSAFVTLDLAGVRTLLAQAPQQFGDAEPLLLALPNPDGEFSFFAVSESTMIEPGLAANFPWIKTYAGQGLDDPTATIHIDLTTLGFRAQVLGAERNWAIDPVTFEDTTHYGVYDLSDLPRPRDTFVCHNQDDNAPPVDDNPFATNALGTQLRSYRLAVATTPSYSTFYANNAANTLSGIVTTVNRMNQIYERDLSVRYVLVANNNLLIYSGTSPYSDGDLGTMLGENQSNITSVIGTANFDIGHVFSGLNLGGLAARPSACSASNKARAGTGLSNPTGDFWTIQYVSHEVGHQMNANHSFNANDGGVCLNNRAASAAYEPGSGSTIMSYRGLCGASNNLPATDAMFNQGSYAEIRSFIIGGGNCAALTNTGNTLPVITGLTARQIPKGTAFFASATATDANSDTLTYSWEQRSLGAAQSLLDPDNGASPLFRVFLPSASNTRFFPRYEDIIDGSLSTGEQYPTVGRSMVLRLLVRDNRAGGGGTSFADVTYTISNTAGPFAITSNNAAGQNFAAGSATITWNVAGTNAAPINTSNVRIRLSIDNGSTWPYDLALSTPNDGSETVTLPAVTSSNNARVRIDAIGNVYYDVTDARVSIACPAPPVVTAANECSRVLLSWDAVPGATGYRVLRALASSPAATTQIASLNSNALSFADTGAVAGVNYVYQVRITGALCTAGGPLSAQVVGRRTPVPTITTQPVSSTVNEGATVSFTVAATDAATFAWQRNAAPLTNGGGIAGADTPTLQLTNVQASQAGTYTCIVTNPCGSRTSAQATLEVIVSACDDIDFNNDALFPDDADLIDFLNVLAGGACSTDPTPGCNDIDFNNDGLFPDDSDLVTFLQVLAGQPC